MLVPIRLRDALVVAAAVAACTAAYLSPWTRVLADEVAIEEVAIEIESQTEKTASRTEPPADTKLGEPTHKQIGTITTNPDGLPKVDLHCFCLSGTGTILAGCGDDPGEIRLFDPDGQYLSSWEVPVKPEAVNVDTGGNVYVAGEGRLMKFTADGELLLEKESPHAATIKESAEKIREEVIEQIKRTAEVYQQQIDQYEEQIKRLQDLSKEGEELSSAQQQQLDSLIKAKDQYAQMLAERFPDAEMTDEQLAERVQSMIQYKLRFASIDAVDGSVFVATPAAVGYTYEVWRMNDQFAGAEKIVTDLRGCCGQMDVQACADGLFVAENSRHRVSRYELAGDLATSWGKRAREGLRGFGSCCNPMNVAFGPDGTVYTAESTSGRIKRYSMDGELLDLIGTVDLVPGCKKVSIGVGKNGDCVYMLDITRQHIVMMERIDPNAEPAAAVSKEQPASTNVSKLAIKLLKRLARAMGPGE